MLPRALSLRFRVVRAGASYRYAGAAPFSTSRPSQLTSITPSRDELLNATLSQRHIQSALEAFHRDGLVVIENVVSHEDIDRLNHVMVRDAHRLMARGKDGPFNYNLGNLQQSPPYDPDVFKRNIFVNPFATRVTSAILGGRPTMSFISANTAVKAEEGQPVHSDADFEHPKIPFAAVVNVGLVDMSPTNGSTQVWLGTHRDTDLSCQEGAHGERASGRIRRDLLDEREEVSPPIQPTIKKGCIIIRDLRLWHAGMPNRTDTIRVMLAMIHFAPWYRQRMTLRLPRALRPVLESDPNLGVAAEWTDDEVDHLLATYGNAFDFSQDE